MAARLPKDSTDPVAALIHELQSARWRSDALLRHAVPYADDIAPAVIATVEQAADGVYLLPKQANLLFWGIHILGAAHHAALYRPLLRLLRHHREEFSDPLLLGDAATATVPRILISTFDGDSDALIEALADQSTDSFVRWGLFEALARLTFDGHVPRQTTTEFLDRFDRERMAEPEDAAWQGWIDAITDLGIEDLYDRVRSAWEDGRIPPDLADRDLIEERFAEASALPRGDPTMFVKYGRKPIDDPAEALDWTAQEPDPPKAAKHSGTIDPGADTRLDGDELDWLEGFLDSDKVPPNAMILEQLDGFFSALVAGPSIPLIEYMPVIWDTGDDPDPDGRPSYDSVEQAEYVTNLLQRHLATIKRRLDDGCPHGVILKTDPDDLAGRYWAGGFIRGVAMRAREWGTHPNPFIKPFLESVVALGTDEDHLGDIDIDLEFRDRLLDALPVNLVRLHHLWRGHEDPYPPPTERRYEGRKVGRNEPCPCGSGKKFKFCCGSPTRGETH